MPPLDFIVTAQGGWPAARPCAECGAQLATVRITVERVERGGALVCDSQRETCANCAAKVGDRMRAQCQYRLYQGRKV